MEDKEQVRQLMEARKELVARLTNIDSVLLRKAPPLPPLIKVKLTADKDAVIGELRRTKSMLRELWQRSHLSEANLLNALFDIIDRAEDLGFEPTTKEQTVLDEAAERIQKLEDDASTDAEFIAKKEAKQQIQPSLNALLMPRVIS